ncbi:hypothetical protein HMPREF9456_02193 [Dysgonomonas mossii DSM 22836]|uniref:Uncharacterized protein n=1 Tax=Dysgonomonas mossii DSM 22836 TaxID=742767 RepID=F8X2B3_9BACT|nr:hypothetical protein HMPREF9456_02193 [Dysgonomonas mossii DSM 22836]
MTLLDNLAFDAFPLYTVYICTFSFKNALFRELHRHLFVLPNIQ